MLIDYLQSELATRSQKNPSYSLRAFARSLKFDPATLSAILNGKRPLTLKTTKKILDHLDLDPLKRRKILIAAMGESERPQHSHPDVVLQKEVFEAVASWEHDAILCVLQLSHFSATVSSIAKRLRIGNSGTVLNALYRMEKLGLARKVRGKWEATNAQLATTTDIPSNALKKVHRQYIEKSLKALQECSPSERDITGTTMAVSKEKLPCAKKMIREFRKELCRFLEEGKKNEVFRLNIQLFPLGDK